MTELWQPFVEFQFMRRALVGCVALSLSAPLVGVFLMLRRMSLTGDAMAHGILPGVALGYLAAGLSLGAMTLGGMLAGLVIAVASALVARHTALREDSSLAAFYLISLSLGVLIISTQGSSVDLFHVLFGTILALNDEAILLLGAISGITLVSLAFLYRPLVMECLDPAFLKSVSRMSPVAHHGFMFLLVLNLLAGFHALGTLLAVGIMILPAAAARFWAREITRLLALSVAIALTGSVTGLWLSYVVDVPTGPLMVLVLGTVYIVSLLFGPHGLRQSLLPTPRHLRA